MRGVITSPGPNYHGVLSKTLWKLAIIFYLLITYTYPNPSDGVANLYLVTEDPGPVSL